MALLLTTTQKLLTCLAFAREILELHSMLLTPNCQKFAFTSFALHASNLGRHKSLLERIQISLPLPPPVTSSTLLQV